MQTGGALRIGSPDASEPPGSGALWVSDPPPPQVSGVSVLAVTCLRAPAPDRSILGGGLQKKNIFRQWRPLGSDLVFVPIGA